MQAKCVNCSNSQLQTFVAEVIVKPIRDKYQVVSSKMIIHEDLTYLVKGLEGRTYGGDIRHHIAVDAREMINSWQQGWKAGDVIVALYEVCMKCNSILPFPIRSCD